MTPSYNDFLKSKVKLAEAFGFDLAAGACNAALKPHQCAATEWMVSGGRRALFGSFGTGKSVVQLETIRLTIEQAGGMGLIVLPLGVKQEFVRDAMKILGWAKGPKFIRRIEECDDPTGIYLTNYETVRDGKLDPCEFTAVTLDEAAVLRGIGGSKTFREFMRLFTGDGGPSGNHRTDGKTVKYRFVATATPSPNDYIELLAYADFLGIMDISQAKTRFFKRDSEKADKLTLHAHKEAEFWMWVASWALFIQKPSDLGYSDEGYEMPPINVRWHKVDSNHGEAGNDKSGQGRLLRDAAIGIQDAAAEKRTSMAARLAKMRELLNERPADHVIIWHDLEDERKAIQRILPEAVSVYGSQELEERERAILGFSDGEFQILSTKPVIAGSGCNFQRHCHWEIFIGIGFKFADFIQAIHRVLRYGQTQPVTIDIIYSEAEYSVKATLEKKWKQHNIMVQKMTALIREYGLSKQAMAHHLTRRMGVDRVVIEGERYKIVNNDSVVEAANLEEGSVHLVLTSIPFASQYEYSPNYADFGHSEGNNEFFEQMDFLTPSLYRCLQPGRIAAIHVKDRIVPGGMTGLGFQTVYPFHMEVTRHFVKHGFAYLGMKTIVTDVVRENEQTYRLGWSEQCKDGSRMGVGMPEYLLIFRKPQTDRTKGYADVPVVKLKGSEQACQKCDKVYPEQKRGEKALLTCPACGGEILLTMEDEDYGPLCYSRGKWQVDAHGFTRSSGNRLLEPEDLAGLSHADIFQAFKKDSLENVYSFEQHVKIAESLDLQGQLPSGFMLLQPQSWSDEVWADITRMLTLNGAQASKGKEKHLCPLQFDIVDRAIDQYTMRGEKVYDPFGGLMTVPYRAIQKGRYGIGSELNPLYFLDGAAYCKAAENDVLMPTLFDLAGLEERPRKSA